MTKLEKEKKKKDVFSFSVKSGRKKQHQNFRAWIMTKSRLATAVGLRTKGRRGAEKGGIVFSEEEEVDEKNRSQPLSIACLVESKVFPFLSRAHSARWSPGSGRATRAFSTITLC